MRLVDCSTIRSPCPQGLTYFYGVMGVIYNHSMTHRILSYSEYIDQVCKIHKTINKYKILAMYVQINVSKSKLLLHGVCL